jgi:hypothetical protein
MSEIKKPKKPIYPEMEVFTDYYKVVLHTYVRKRDSEGVYRLIEVREVYWCHESEREEMFIAAVANLNRRAMRVWREWQFSGPMECEKCDLLVVRGNNRRVQPSNWELYEINRNNGKIQETTKSA